MKNKLMLVAFLLVACTRIVLSQITPEWIERYGGAGTGHEDARKVVADNSGNVYVGGFELEGAPGNEDFLLLKYNFSGGLVWERRYAGPENGADYISDLGIDNAGNIYVTGVTYVFPAGNQISVTIKYNPGGDSLWVRKKAGNGRSNFVTASGNVYVTAPTALYNTNGVLQWIDTTDGGSEIVADTSGNVYITRAIYHPGDNGCDFSTVKFNSAGIKVWDSRYLVSDGFFAIPQSVAVSQTGNVYVTGRNGISGTIDNWDITTIKYNSSGVQQWLQTYHSGGYAPAEGNSLKIDNSENVYVAGTTGETSGMVTLKYNSGGNLQWIHTSLAGTTARELVLDGANNVYVTGRKVGGLWQCITEKYNSSGQLQWSSSHTSGGDCEGYSIAIDAIENIYVTGLDLGSGHRNCLTIKYSHPTGIAQNTASVPEEFSLSQNYPNPFNPVTIINYELAITKHVTLKVFDISGKEVITLVNQKQDRGTYSVDWNAGGFPSGVYFYELKAEEFSETKKMTLIK